MVLIQCRSQPSLLMASPRLLPLVVSLPVSWQSQEVFCGVTFDIRTCGGAQEGEQLRSLRVTQHLLTESDEEQ